MITITLNQIRASSPCQSGWKKVLKAHEHLGMDTPFPVSNILESNDLNDTLWACYNCFEDKTVVNRWVVWCARQVQHLMSDQRSIAALDVIEAYLNGNATLEELNDAAYDAYDAAARAAARAAYDAARAARAAADAAARAAADAALAALAARAAADAAARAAADAAAARDNQIAQLKMMLNNEKLES